MHAMWGLGQAMFTKVIVVVDGDVNLHDPSEVAWKALNNIDPARDLELARGPVDVLDHASQLLGFGGKLGVDATRKWPGEGFAREWPDLIENTPEVRKRMAGLWERVRAPGRPSGT